MVNPGCPVSYYNKTKIEMGHGGGGRMTADLINTIFQPFFDNEYLNQQHDGAIFKADGTRLAFTTDSFVVNPLFFPGGNIGDLAVNGTVNDLLCCGAIPDYLSCGFIIEEGFEIEKLKTIVETMSTAAREAGIKFVTGDTKVVEHGKCDGVYINTSGIGHLRENINISPFNVKKGDKVIITGEIGNHGIAIMSVREGIKFSTKIKSDTASLTDITERLLDVIPETRLIRDPTRGGLSSTLNEIAGSAGVTINIYEMSLPVNPGVKAACELLGIDPLYVANEGIMIVIVPGDKAEKALDTIRAAKHGSKAMIIGDVTAESEGIVTLTLPLGQKRIIEMLSGEQLPRIC